ncbi:alpha/beta fold hydrolase [Phytoactinopolyspora halotolerans]|nr:alpha/beta hydrolase [Phytoactinopolyspora halotolerans]
MHAAVLGPSGAEPVVCVHGLGVSHRYFGPFARSLAHEVRVVAPDLPGFGRTAAPSRHVLDVRELSEALAKWLRATGRAGAVMVANSAGCQVVVDLAAHAPDLVGPVVLNGPTVDRHARSVPRQIVRLIANVPLERPSLGLLVARDYLSCGPRRVWGTFRCLLDDPVEGKLPAVQSRAVVVRGARDPVSSRAWAAEVAGLLPRGSLVEVPGAGHTLNYSAPEELARITRELMRDAGNQTTQMKEES